MKIFTYRYMWKLKDIATVNFKIVTDTHEGLELFEKNLLDLENLESAGKEYLHEYDCALVGKFDKLYNMEDNK